MDDLIVVGYQCRFFDNATSLEDTSDDSYLLPCPTNEDVLIDRFDVRALVDDVGRLTSKESNYIEFVDDVPLPELDDERYRDCPGPSEDIDDVLPPIRAGELMGKAVPSRHPCLNAVIAEPRALENIVVSTQPSPAFALRYDSEGRPMSKSASMNSAFVGSSAVSAK